MSLKLYQEESSEEESNHNYENSSIEKIPLLARNDNSKGALQIKEYKAQLVQNYGQGWVQFFQEFKSDNEAKLNVRINQNQTLYIQPPYLTTSFRFC